MGVWQTLKMRFGGNRNGYRSSRVREQIKSSRNSGRGERAAARLWGQAPWHRSQPQMVGLFPRAAAMSGGSSPFSWDQWERQRDTSHPPSPRAPVGQAVWQARQSGGQRVPSLGPVEARGRSVRMVPKNT